MRSFLLALRHSPLIFIFALPTLVLADGFTQCYYPDGSIPVDYVYTPCSTTAAQSACCAGGDICQEDGLCYYPNSDGPGRAIYRGACTDRTFNDPSCHADVCVTGFETTWQWAIQCGSTSNPSYACGILDGGIHKAATCPDAAATVTSSYRTTTATTSAGRYTPPPSVDTKIFTVITSTLQATISASAVGTTYTTTWQTTITQQISTNEAAATNSHATATSSLTAGSSTSTSASNSDDSNETPSKTGKIVLTTGILIAIIVIPFLLLLLLGVGIFLCLRRRQARKHDDAIRLNSAVPPPNNPVGADQTYPYEVPINEAKLASAGYGVGGYKQFHGPKVGSHEVDAQGPAVVGMGTGMGTGKEKFAEAATEQQVRPNQQAGAGGYYPHPHPISNNAWRRPGEDDGRAELSPVTPMRSPAPAYSRMEESNGAGLVELADTSRTQRFRSH